MTTEELRNPDWNMEKDVIIRSSEGTEMHDSVRGLTLKANVILLSYNRPKMIRKAIQSVLDSTYENFDIWIADDGSDFDVEEIVKEFEDGRILWMQREKMSPEERARRSRIGENINQIMDQIPDNEMIYYLCDDDLFDKHWLARSIASIERSPSYHIVTGDSYYFFDGEDPVETAKPGLPLKGIEIPEGVPRLWWGIGSFTHRAGCYHKEGVKWYDSYYGHSIDTNFIADMWACHTTYLVIDKPTVYRREHKNMLSAKLGRKDEDGRYYSGMKPGPLKPQMIEGWME